MAKIHINILLDKSGSMSSVRDSTIKVINDFITEQKQEPDSENVSVTLVAFNTEYHSVFNNVPLLEVPLVVQENYDPQGGTNLYISLHRLIAETEESISSLPVLLQPEKVLYVVITDGQDTSGLSPNAVRKLVQEKTDCGRTFVFLAQDLSHGRDPEGQKKTQDYYARSIGIAQEACLCIPDFESSVSVAAPLTKSVLHFRSSATPASAKEFWTNSTNTPAPSSKPST